MMLVALIQVVFAAIRTVTRSCVNILLYSLFSRIFHRWFGFNSFISFICSAYCLSKIVNYFKRVWRDARLKAKKPEEKLLPDQLVWQKATPGDSSSVSQFETDWKFLVDDDRKSLFPSIVEIPFNNPWLFIATMMIIDHQMNNMNYSYFYSLLRTIACLIVLICGSSIRYQTLFERERDQILEIVSKHEEVLERFIVYSQGKSVPIASICVQLLEAVDLPTFMVQMYHLNSTFNDYLADVEHFMCQKLIEHVKQLAENKKKSCRIVWSVPSCRKDWTPVLKSNQFTLRSNYADFAFMPLVKSHVEQYGYVCPFEEAPATTENENDKIKTE